MFQVSTSLLNVKEGKEIDTIINLEKARTDFFHIDVMDRKFVEKNTYHKMLDISSTIRRLSNLPIDLHLMVENVKESINDFIDYNPNIITFHIEACKNKQEIFELISLIKNSNSKVGISVKPNTKIEEILDFLPYIHMVLIMTVEPGKGGQAFMEDMVSKISTLKEYINNNNLEIDIEVDGGINLATCDKVKKAGANILVSGVAILMAKNYKDIIDEFKK